MFTSYLKFSDAAKFADIARSIAEGNGWGSKFIFYNQNFIVNTPELFPATNTPPAMPYTIALFFKLFGVSDASVIATSMFFFLLTVIFTYLLANKLFGKLVGVLSAITVAVNINFWDYATTGASETMFMFEVVAIPYLILLRKQYATLSAAILTILMYFTRPQAFIFIAAYILLYLFINFETKKALAIFVGVLIIGFLVDRLVLLPLNGQYHLYSITGRGTHAVTQHSQSLAVSDVIRGVEKQPSSIVLTIKKTTTHLFNFYRTLPSILNPYLFALFAMSPIILFKKKKYHPMLVITFFAAVLSFLLPALTIPFYRYIHPVLPLVYITSIGVLVVLIRKYLGGKSSQLPALISFSYVLIFVVLLQAGIFIHDTRYFATRSNTSKPPVYVVLSQKLQENTIEGDFIVTNLDTWGSWYGERKTMWFPLRPEQLMLEESDNVDAIYLTSYKIDDENYFMGSEWREIFINPESHEIELISENFSLEKTIEIKANEVYENTDARAILLTRNEN